MKKEKLTYWLVNCHQKQRNGFIAFITFFLKELSIVIITLERFKQLVGVGTVQVTTKMPTTGLTPRLLELLQCLLY